MRCILPFSLLLLLLLPVWPCEEPSVGSYWDESEKGKLPSFMPQDSILYETVLPWINSWFGDEQSKDSLQTSQSEVNDLESDDRENAGDPTLDSEATDSEERSPFGIPVPGEYLGTSPVPDPLEVLLGRRSERVQCRSDKRDGQEDEEEDTSRETGIHKRKGIVGLKTILLRYFIMPAKRTLAFLFEEVDQDTHFVMKKSGAAGTSGKVEKKYACLATNHSSASVRFIPEGDLMEEMNRSSSCGFVLFYTPYCRFSMELLPSYQALARLFPRLNLLAVMINSYSSSCIQFGAVGTPTVMLFHDSRPIRKMPGHVRNITAMSEYVVNITDLEPVGAIELQESD